MHDVGRIGKAHAALDQTRVSGLDVGDAEVHRGAMHARQLGRRHAHQEGQVSALGKSHLRGRLKQKAQAQGVAVERDCVLEVGHRNQDLSNASCG